MSLRLAFSLPCVVKYLQLLNVRTSTPMMSACCEMVRAFAQEIVNQKCQSSKPVAKKTRVVARKRPQVRAVMDSFISTILICNPSLHSFTTRYNRINLVWLRAGMNIRRAFQVRMFIVPKARDWFICMCLTSLLFTRG